MVFSSEKDGLLECYRWLFGGLKIVVYLLFRPVYEVKMVGGAGESGVKPVDIVGVEHLLCHLSLIDIHMFPLSALRLMAGDGIAKLDL